MAKQPRSPRAQTPVTRHPLFPGIVALWFGALFGLGSLAIRPGLIESAILGAGIDAVIPAAGPPLGVTARILIALSLAALGGVLGAFVARRLAQPRIARSEGEGVADKLRVRTRDAHPDSPVRRPLSVPDEIAAAPLDAAPGAFPGRRRALAIAEDAPQFRAHEYAPLPGGAVYAANEPAAEPEALDLGAFVAPDQSEPAPVADVAPAVVPSTAEEGFRPLSELAPLPPVDAVLPQVFVAAPIAQAAEPECVPTEPEAAPAQVFGIDASPPALAAPTPSVSPLASVAAEPLFAPPPPPIDFARLGLVEPRLQTEAAAAPFADPPSPEPTAPPLDGLDLSALTERFAASLRARRERQGETASEAIASPPVSLEPETAARFGSAEFKAVAAAAPDEPPAPQPAAVPAAFRPLVEDEDNDDGEIDGMLPLRQFRLPTSEAADVPGEPVDEAVEDEPDPEGEGYSSLLELGRPVAAQRQAFVRIEEPDADRAAIEPVVIFPGQTARLAPSAPVPLAVPQPLAAPAPPVEFAAADGLLRRFDAPSSAQPGQAVTAAGASPVVDREETERALRAALATLQRMSGAA